MKDFPATLFPKIIEENKNGEDLFFEIQNPDGVPRNSKKNYREVFEIEL